MPERLRAKITPAILIWAREQSHFTVEEAAKKIGVPTEMLAAWESSTAQPTISQLRKTAHVYRYSLAVFFLSQPPLGKFQPIRDFRRFTDGVVPSVSSALQLAIREAYDKRESALDLFGMLDEKPNEFTYTTTLNADPERVAAELRQYFGIGADDQLKWKDPQRAFTDVRLRFEHQGILVFQFSHISAGEARGFSIGEFPLPSIVVNRTDTTAGRLFSLFHEVTHIALRNVGICNEFERSAPSRNVKKDVEVFCNYVAGAVLIPKKDLLGHPVVHGHGAKTWSIDDLGKIALTIACSRYALARRLLIFDVITPTVYDRLVAELNEQFSRRPKQKGFISPAENVVSLGGNVFPGLVLEAFSRDHISASTVSNYLGLKLKHLQKVRSALDRAL
ncbi:MAG: XRE family transcriptional regulator [Candidatus Zixiibacteriota bacterium]